MLKISQSFQTKEKIRKLKKVKHTEEWKLNGRTVTFLDPFSEQWRSQKFDLGVQFGISA